MFIGKVIGVVAGFSFGGIVGAILGGIVGHTFDRGLKLSAERRAGAASYNMPWGRQKPLGDDAVWHRHSSDRALPEGDIQAVFFKATFLVMGRIAKSDGRVSDEEIALAQSLMDQLQLSPNMKRHAIELFTQGKQDDFDYRPILSQFHSLSGYRITLIQLFMEIQCQAAYVDGVLHQHELALIKDVAQQLFYPKRSLDQILRRYHVFYGRQDDAQQQGGQGGRATESVDTLSKAYGLLGVEQSASDAEVKRAYRRLMSQHHPDKLVAKGLPEEMMALATEKTQEISAAYELIQKNRQAS
jgi:DnaJ like chaperone protein